MSRPGVLLDRDGTIIADHGYIGSVGRVEFLDGAIEAIATLNRAGIPVAVVTNQAGVARGGAKVTGAGGGGFLLAVRPLESQRAVREQLAHMKELPINIEPFGSRVVLNVHRDIWG